ncbi:hypothetical protein, partial [Streptomyces sp. NPDC002172]
MHDARLIWFKRPTDRPSPRRGRKAPADARGPGPAVLASACACTLFLTWGVLAPRPELAHAQ